MKSGKTKEGAKKSSKPKQNEQETLKITKTPKLPLKQTPPNTLNARSPL
jgi:hypothetical protein